MNNIITSPNQRVLTIHRDMPQKGSKELFTAIKNENLYAAMKDLNPSEFRLYIAIASLTAREEYTLAFSPQYLHELTTLSENTIRTAFKSLEEKHYILPSPDARNRYEFYEKPRSASFKLPTVYVYYNGDYYPKEEFLKDNPKEEVEAFWSTQIKYMKNAAGEWEEIK